MRIKIDYTLHKNNQKLVDKKNIKGTIINNTINYQDEFGSQEVNLNNKTYIKENNEYKLHIDFIKKTCKIILNNKEEVNFNLECNLKTEKEIIINYIIEEPIIIKINYIKENK